MRMQPLLTAFMAAMLFSVALAVEAAPIVYAESVDGPLKEHPGDHVQHSDFLVLGMGTNVWIGTLFDDRYETHSAVFDTAAFRLAGALQIEQIRITTNNFQVVSGNWANYRVEIFKYGISDLAIESLGFEDFLQPNLVQANRSVFDDVIPLADGLYSISFAAYGFNFGVFPASFDYRIEIDTVRAVPEPGSLALFCAGLAGIGAFARRRHRCGDDVDYSHGIPMGSLGQMRPRRVT